MSASPPPHLATVGTSRRRLLSILLVATLFPALAGCAAVQASEGNQAANTPSNIASATPTPVSYAVYGDSITIADSPDTSEPLLGTWSWTRFVNDTVATYSAGYARGGVSTRDLLEVAKPMEADVLVIMAGTNDIYQSIPRAETLKNIEKIVAKTGIKRVILSYIAPFDPRPSPIKNAPILAEKLNDSLAKLAEENGWSFVDPMKSFRSGDEWANRAKMTPDGVHPYTAAAKLIGQSMTKAIAASVENG